MIDMNKKYRTRDGRDVRILCTDAAGTYSVVFQVLPCNDIHSATKGGEFCACFDCDLDLIEVLPYEDFKIDDPVMVSDDGKRWLKRYFAGVNNARPCTYTYGSTSWTCSNNTRCGWNYCRRPTKEEFAK